MELQVCVSRGKTHATDPSRLGKLKGQSANRLASLAGQFVPNAPLAGISLMVVTRKSWLLLRQQSYRHFRGVKICKGGLPAGNRVWNVVAA